MTPNAPNTMFPSWPNPVLSISDADPGIQMGGIMFWTAVGPALEAYDKIRLYIRRRLLDRETYLYNEFGLPSVPHSIACFMVGKHRTQARPYVVVTCSLAAFCRRVKQIITEAPEWDQLLREHAGFGRFALLRCFPRHLSDARDPDLGRMPGVDGPTVYSEPIWTSTFDMNQSPYGTPIWLRQSDPNPSATLGGIVYLNDKPYGLTVAHPFEQGFFRVMTVRDENAGIILDLDEIDDFQDLDPNGTPSASMAVLQSLSHSSTHQSTPLPQIVAPQLLGEVAHMSRAIHADAGDWALIELAKTKEMEGLLHSSSGSKRCEEVDNDDAVDVQDLAIKTVSAPNKKGTKVYILSANGKLVRGILSTNTSLVCLAGGRGYLSLYTILLTEDLASGDGGKWVLDDQGNWYGHVVAGVAGLRTAYMAPAVEIVSQILAWRQTTLVLEDRRSLGDKLRAAVEVNHTKLVQSLLDSGAGIDSSGRDGAALHVASAQGHTDMVQLLIDNGANIDLLAGSHRYALQAAIHHFREDVVRLLLESGARVYEPEGENNSALHMAAEKGYMEISRLLVAYGAEINAQPKGGETPLQAAARRGHATIVRLLLDNGADIGIYEKGYDTALYVAAKNRHQEIVKFFIERGAQLNVQAGDQGTALHVAVVVGDVEMVRLLLGFGANPDAVGAKDATALHVAAATPPSADRKQVAQLLIDAGADVNRRGGLFVYALQAAAYRGNADVVQLLLESGANVNAEGGKFRTALQALLRSGQKPTPTDVACIRMLLDAGADVNVGGHQFDTALQAAAFHGSAELLRMILDRGADINAIGPRLGTALQVAAAHHDDERVVQFLLEKGADPCIWGGEIGPALHAAAEFAAGSKSDKNKKVIQTLLDAGAPVNVVGGPFGTAIQAVLTSYGNSTVAKMLLDAGADVNIRGGSYGTALQAAAASFWPKEPVLQMVLDAGAEVDANVPESEFGTAIQAAAYYAKDKTMRMLIGQGKADVNVRGGRFGTALQAAIAASYNHAKLVKMLLDAGADVNIRGGEYGSALQAARQLGRPRIVQLLVEHGATE